MWVQIEIGRTRSNYKIEPASNLTKYIVFFHLPYNPLSTRSNGFQVLVAAKDGKSCVAHLNGVELV